MATMTITFPDPVATRIITALCHYGNRPADSTIPEAQYAKKVVTEWMEGVTHQYEGVKASDEAYKAAKESSVEEIVIS